MPVRNYKILVALSKQGKNRISKIIKSERGTDRRAKQTDWWTDTQTYLYTVSVDVDAISKKCAKIILA